MSAQRTALIVAGYVAAYVALDWVTYIHPLGPFAITPWNPPPGLPLPLMAAASRPDRPVAAPAAIAQT